MHRLSRVTRPSRLGVVAAASALVLVLGAVPWSSPTSVGADTAAEQREVKAQRAALAGEIDTLEASDAEVSAALAALEANVASTRAQMADARRAADAAEARAVEAERQAAETATEIERLRGEVVEAAVDAYVRPEGEELLDLLQEDSANQASTKQALLSSTNGDKLDAVDEFAAAKRRLEDQRDEARAARDEAEQERAALAETAAGYEAAQAEQQRVASEIGARLGDKLAEAEALASLDAQLSDRLAAEQAALAAQLAAAQRAAAQQAAAGAGGSSGGGGGGSSSGGSSGGGGGPVTQIPRPGGLTSVRGITVAGSIAGNLAALLEAASAAGIHLTGTGYRDPSMQIELRKQHCGTSQYAIWQMNPDSCSPPTAIPGRSKHEQGLAVDFAHNGRSIQSRSSAAFQWLAANAGRYGFVNLPSEPWHWSTDGS